VTTTVKVIMKSRMRESRTYGSAKEFTSRGVDLLNYVNRSKWIEPFWNRNGESIEKLRRK
ncbi:MAG: hypothetical protein ACLR3P_28790, partial [Hungatella sp.]|uniref:hypothetical protein n=1 Tax=Hungatella sp. TaxID=2613924 RepID=UPI0039A1ED16